MLACAFGLKQREVSIMVKVNLGSGFIGLPDWINYDNSIVARASKYPGLIRLCVKMGLLPAPYRDIQWPPIVCHDCRRGIPLKDASVDVIYSSHFFEHLYRFEVIALLKECLRILKPNGVIRVALPDLNTFVERYKANDPLNVDAGVARANTFVEQFYPSLFSGERPPSFVERIQEYFLAHHKWMYTFESFQEIMKKAGFVDVCRKQCCEGTVPDIEKLDTLSEISFYLEARPRAIS